MMNNKNEIVIFFALLFVLTSTSPIHKFTLTYAYTPDFQRKFPIKLSFSSSETTLPF